MTVPHDCAERMKQLRETIEKNKDKLVDHDVELERKKSTPPVKKAT